MRNVFTVIISAIALIFMIMFPPIASSQTATTNVSVPQNTRACVKQTVKSDAEAQKLKRKLEYSGEYQVTFTKANKTTVQYEGTDQVRPALNASKIALSGCN